MPIHEHKGRSIVVEGGSWWFDWRGSRHEWSSTVCGPSEALANVRLYIDDPEAHRQRGMCEARIFMEPKETNGWISVDERMPPSTTAHAREKVLIVWGAGKVGEASYNAHSGWSTEDATHGWMEPMLVTHWQPLPPPPESL